MYVTDLTDDELTRLIIRVEDEMKFMRLMADRATTKIVELEWELAHMSPFSEHTIDEAGELLRQARFANFRYVVDCKLAKDLLNDLASEQWRRRSRVNFCTRRPDANGGK